MQRASIAPTRFYHPYHSIHHSSFPISNPLFDYFFFPQRPKTHLLPLILLARWSLAVCLDLCALHIAAYPSSVGNLSTSNCLYYTPPLSVTVDSPTNPTCIPPSRCCLSYYDNLRPAWDISKIKVDFAESRSVRLTRETKYIYLNRHIQAYTL